MKLEKILVYLLVLFLFLLPWQTRLVYQSAFLSGGFWEYGSLSIYATEVLLWVIILLFIVDRFKTTEVWRTIKQRKKIYWIVSGFVLLFFVLQLWRSSLFWVSYQMVFRVLEGVCLAIILPRVGRTAVLLVSFWSGAVAQGLFACYQFFTQYVPHIPGFGLAPQSPATLGVYVVETVSERWLRAYGSFGSPNILGGYLALAWLIGLLLYVYFCKKPWQKIVVTAAQLVIISGLIFSFSREAWLAILGGSITFVLFNVKRVPILKQISFSFVLAILLVCIFHSLFFARATPSLRLEARSFNERAGQYHEALSLFSPPIRFLVGTGPGLYTHALWHSDKWRPVWQYQPVHNMYLLMLVELGAVGFGIFVSFYFLIIKRVYQVNKMYFSVIVALLVLGLFDHWLWSLYVGQMVWWALLGLGITSRK